MPTMQCLMVDLVRLTVLHGLLRLHLCQLLLRCRLSPQACGRAHVHTDQKFLVVMPLQHTQGHQWRLALCLSFCNGWHVSRGHIMHAQHSTVQHACGRADTQQSPSAPVQPSRSHPLSFLLPGKHATIISAPDLTPALNKISS